MEGRMKDFLHIMAEECGNEKQDKFNIQRTKDWKSTGTRKCKKCKKNWEKLYLHRINCVNKKKSILRYVWMNSRTSQATTIKIVGNKEGRKKEEENLFIYIKANICYIYTYIH